MQDIYTILQQYFGYTAFRPLQEDIINDILHKKDVFVLMPTGGGKSLCYQLPSILMDGTTIVISPLISLMKDQVDSLSQIGVKAAYLNSSLSFEQQTDVINKLTNGQLSLLYVAPERVIQQSFLSILKRTKINFFTIDEAHCISQWGHDFRPEYGQLRILREAFPDQPMMALTATATPRVKQDIIQRLSLKNATIYQASFNRPNLSYYVFPKKRAFEQTLDYIQSHKSSAGIVYCLSRKTTEQVATKLQKEGIRALPYHARLDPDVRRTNQEKFLRDDVDVIVATIAFGMGIDKPNVRYVIHYDLPKTLENYYQETGRAGRDGLSSDCLFLFSYGDKISQERFIREKEDEEERQISYAQLDRMIEYAQSKLCRRTLLLQYFAEEYSIPNCKSCDNCLVPRETFDATILTQKILSCVYRLQERFGMPYVINVLTGSKAERILENNHDNLSTYGIVADYTKTNLRMLMYELIQQGYLKISNDQYAVISLTAKSKSVLLGKEKVMLTKTDDEEIIQEKSINGRSTSDTGLFAILRTLRKKLADEAHVPPYIIFNDKTLQEMTFYFPQTLEQFASIHGVGREKLQKYGDIFINEIKKYCEEKGIHPVNNIKKYSFRKS